MEITLDLIKKLREETGIGIMECKQALIEAEGDLEKAKKILREKGKEFLSHKGRETKEGRVEAYIHHSGKVGVLVEVNTVTDFAANSQEFRDFIKNLAMHIAASKPRWISPEDVPEDVVEEEKEILRTQAEKEGKPSHIVEKIVEGRIQKFFEENCLLKQPYVKDPSLTVEDVLGELRHKISEQIVIKRFARFEVGEE
jgi:elongation factor Ts